MLPSPFSSPAAHPITRRTKEAMTVACFFRKGSSFSSNRSFSGIIFIFSKAPAFSSSSMVASP
jgi:hypothetical protein